MTNKELEQLDATDTIVEFSLLCQQYGVRNVLQMLRTCDRAMFDELKTQITRLDVPMLLVSYHPNAGPM
jgi:hypothetical protein